MAVEGLESSQRLEGGVLAPVWASIIQLALLDRRRTLELPDGVTWEMARASLPRAQTIAPASDGAAGSTPRRLWAWPSWLLGGCNTGMVDAMV